MEALKQIIEQSFGLRPEHFPPEVQNSVDEVIKLLQQGKLRVAEKIDGEWVTHEWIKKAVLLSFQLYPNKMVRAGDLSFFDKVPSRFDHFRSRLERIRHPLCAHCCGSPRQLHRSERCIDALLCQHRRLHRRKHHGRYLVNGRFLRSSR